MQYGRFARNSRERGVIVGSNKILLRAVMVLAVTGALAAEPLPDGLRRCAAIADVSVRVACYDRLSGTAPAVAVPAPTVAVAAPAPATAPVPVAAPATAYGNEDLKKSSADRAADTTPKSIDARVTVLHEMAPNVFLISLDNGQVWQQEEARPAFSITVGDTVRILSGALGSHSMSPLSKGQTTGWARATRRK
jgi:hypothetical protein